jgi:amino acid transporter
MALGPGRSYEKRGSLSTFAGVFTPSILTILGVILFRRTGYVVGQAGLAQTLIIIGMAYALAVLTSVSLAAIATNIRVKKGGDYYLISRTLGVEFGGAIGVVLFMAQTVSIAFYCIGFGEAVAEVVPWTTAALPRLIAAGAILFLFIFAWMGADWATRLQYVVMTVLFAALASFFYGGAVKWGGGALAANWSAPEGGLSFWMIFAIFFPAVTGFTQGVSMSGELKDPGRSLPLGTFLAVGLSLIVYCGAALFFAGSLTSSELSTDLNAMNRVARFGALVSAGVIAATLSSAMASYMGAPRILQAIAADRIMPFILPFAKGAGRDQNPRRGVLLSTGIALATVALGDLNTLAPVVTMFFLISYGLLNYATYFEGRAASPSFRPRFRWFDKRLSLAGAVGCLAAMLAINAAAAAVSLAVLFGIHQYLKRTGGHARWAHGVRSYNFQRIRELLFQMDAEPAHFRDWRPQILVFSKDERRRKQLLEFSTWIEGGSGLTTVVIIMEATGPEANRLKEEEYESFYKEIRESETKAFPLVVTAPDFRTGMNGLLQTHGIGPLKANLMLLNWLEEHPQFEYERSKRTYGRNMREAVQSGCNVVVLDADDEEWHGLESIPAQERRIDVWWGGGSTGRLMLLLAYLMTRTEDWDGAVIRVLAEGGKKRPERTLDDMEEFLKEARIRAETEIVEKLDDKVLVSYSEDATVVFIPVQLHEDQAMDVLGEPLEELLPRLPVVALVIAGEKIRLRAEPEEGEAAEEAAVEDAATDMEKKARKAEKEAEKAEERAKESGDKLRAARDKGLKEKDRVAYQKIESEATEAEKERDRCREHARKARREADEAARDVDDAQNQPPKKEPPDEAVDERGETGPPEEEPVDEAAREADEARKKAGEGERT